MGSVRLAWRNLRRNRRRTALTAAALALNAALLTGAYSLRAGLVAGMERDATRLATGEVQVHAAGYLRQRSIQLPIPDPAGLLAAARGRGIRAAPRAFGQALASRGPRTVGVRVWGVDPAAEREALDRAGEVAQGSFLADAPARSAVLGRSLARSLRARPGDEIALVAQAADGSLGNDRFRVAGVLGPAGDEVDRRAILLHERDFHELFVTAGRVHEVALSGGGRGTPGEIAALLAARRPDLEVLTWRDLLPQLASLLALWDVTGAIFGLVFALAAGIAVANAMFVTTFERTREYAVVKALGAGPARIVRDVAVEALVLAGGATAVGAAAGALAAAGIGGLDLGRHLGGGVTLSGVAVAPVLRPVLSAAMVALPVGLLTGTSVLAALVPALRAARTDPARTLAQP